MALVLICSDAKSAENRYHGANARIAKVLSDPPASWKAYENAKDGLFSIIHMEHKELVRAKEDGTYHEIIEGLTHLAAACEHAISTMTCD